MSEEQEENLNSPDVHFEPLVKLPLVETKTHEEDEETLVKLRAKLFRYDCSDQPAEWKERGTGEVKLLKHLTNRTVRVVMRRDKTLKICANHYVHPNMDLKPNCKSDKAWIWSTLADYADEEPKPELLAIRFANAENAQKFKTVFDEAKKYVQENGTPSKKTMAEDKENVLGDKGNEEETVQKASNGGEETKEVIEKLKELKVEGSEEVTKEVIEEPSVEGSDVKPNCKTKEEDT